MRHSFPGGQSRQNPELLTEYCPIGHIDWVVVSWLEQSLPAAQGVHEELPGPEKVPMRHKTGAAVLVAQKKPAGQVSHWVEPA